MAIGGGDDARRAYKGDFGKIRKGVNGVFEFAREAPVDGVVAGALPQGSSINFPDSRAAQMPGPPAQIGAASQVGPRRTSEAGRQYIQGYEKFVESVYLDSAGKPTIGIGHLLKEGDYGWLKREFPDGKIPYSVGLALFEDDLRRVENVVNKTIKNVGKLSQHQYDALVSLAFNIGVGAFADSTLAKHINNDDFVAAANQFPVWRLVTKDGAKQESPGLVNRRRADREVFENGIYGRP